MGKLKVKHGTFANYAALASKDADTLYFITDRGLVYKGSTLVTDKIRVTQSGEGSAQQLTIYDDSASTPASYTVHSADAVNAIVETINTAISTHRLIASGTYADGKATGTGYGHVMLSDATDGTAAAADGGTAATPKAVRDALVAAQQYTNTALGNLTGAMVFKGTIGSVLANPTVTALPDTHSVGYTYRVVSRGTYAGQTCEVGDLVICVANGTAANNADWTVAQNNIDGAVTTDERALTDGCVVLGNGSMTVRTLAAGSTHTNQVLYSPLGGTPEWHTLSNEEFGHCRCTCPTAAATAAKVATKLPASLVWQLQAGCVIAVYFTYGCNVANATLNVNSTGAKPIHYRGRVTTADYIWEAGSTVTFMYDGTNYHVIGIDRQIDTALSATSRNAVTNMAVKAALDLKQDALTAGDGVLIGTVGNVDDTIHLDYGAVASANTTKPVTGASVHSAIDAAALSWETIPDASSSNE